MQPGDREDAFLEDLVVGEVYNGHSGIQEYNRAFLGKRLTCLVSGSISLKDYSLFNVVAGLILANVSVR